MRTCWLYASLTCHIAYTRSSRSRAYDKLKVAKNCPTVVNLRARETAGFKMSGLGRCKPDDVAFLFVGFRFQGYDFNYASRILSSAASTAVITQKKRFDSRGLFQDTRRKTCARAYASV
jgi:hypothetical protein